MVNTRLITAGPTDAPWNAVSAFANCGHAVAHVRGSYVPILLQKSAITMREDCLDLLTRLPTMPLLASGSAPTRDLAPLWLGKACIERWWRSSDQFCEAA